MHQIPPESPTPNPSAPLDAADPLGAALKRAYTPAHRPTADIDDHILAAARERLGRRRLHPRLLLVGGALAAAAGLALAFIIISARPRPTPIGPVAGGVTQASPELAADLNADGALDILDALALSNRLRQRGAEVVADFNADGLTDRADVDALALRVVSLGGAG